jgi:hypothetical protein
VSGLEHQLSIPQVDHPDLACQVCRQEALHQRRKRAQLARFGEQRLQFGLRRKDALELWKVHGG